MPGRGSMMRPTINEESDCLPNFPRRSDLERDGVELLVVQLNKANIKPVILYVYYRPPSSSSDGLSLLNYSLHSNPESSCIALVGDFNITSNSWSDNDSTPIS